MAKALKTAALVVGAVALVATGVGAVALGGIAAVSIAGVSTATLFLVSGGLTVAASLLQKTPKVPASQTDRLRASVNPGAFRHTVLGSTAMPVEVRYEEWSGKDQEYCDWIVLHASHACEAIDEIWFETTLAWSRTNGVSGKYAGYFFVPHIVLEGSPANAFTIASGRWNQSARLTGCAYSHWRFKITGNSKKAESPFTGGLPSRITVVGRGAKLYDPRRDSTVPGGNGPMRASDQSTWRYMADDGATIGENLPLQILRVVLGWRIRNPTTGEMKLATGSGVPARRLNLTSMAVAANLADELVNRSVGGQEPRYHGAGVISEGDDPKTVLDMLCTASCARFRDTGGKLSLVIAHNDLAGAATDDGLNDDDVVGPFTWDPDAALESTPNIVRGKYVDATPNSLYQLIEYPEVRIASPDGQDRIFPLDLGVVESPSQAQRIAKQVLQRKQYPREFSAPFDIRAWKYGIGDVVPFTFAPLSFNRRLFRVKDQELGQNGVCNMTLTVEAAAIYAWDADDRAAVQPAEAITYDSRNNPLVLAIADIDAAVTAIFSDGVITHSREKRELVRQWQAIEAQFLALDARYSGLGSPADIAPARGLAYQAYQQLAAYLAGLNPAWDAIDLDTPIPDPALADQRWAAARTKIEAFGAAITGREGPAGADGASSYTLVNVGNCTVGPNSVVKSTGGADWNGKARTAEHAPAATVSALLVPGTFVGLTTDPIADTSFSSIDYAIHWSGNSNIYIYRNGVGTAPLAVRALGAGPIRATVKSDGKQVFYELEGVDLSGQTEIVVLPGADLYGSIAIFSQGTAVNGVTFSRDGSQGAGSTNLVSMSPTTIVAGNSVRGTSGGFWGIDAAYSRESYTGGAVANFTVPAASGDLFMAGLTQGIGGDRGKSYDGISFALHRNGNTGGTGAFINGVQFGAAGPVVPGVLRGRVHFDGRYVRWFVNEQMFAQFDWMGTTYDPHDPANALRFACSLAAVSRIDNISLTAAGTKGRDGRDGTNGTNGLDGTNGQSIHIAYSDAADGSVNFTTGEAGGRTFIGVYTDTNPGADSTNPAAYGWTRLRGLDGTNGLAGPGGYVHIAYANSANGTVDFHLSDPTGRAYIGTYTDQTEPDSGNPATYAWQLVKGADGKDGINGTNGANADQLGLGVLANGSLGMSIPSSGSTTFTDYSQTINVVAGRQFKLTMVAVNGFRNTGGNVAVATIRVVLGNQVLFNGTISVDVDGSIFSSSLEDASTKLIANNVSGSVQLVVTHSRGGPVGNSADFDFNFILERV